MNGVIILAFSFSALSSPFFTFRKEKSEILLKGRKSGAAYNFLEYFFFTLDKEVSTTGIKRFGLIAGFFLVQGYWGIMEVSLIKGKGGGEGRLGSKKFKKIKGILRTSCVIIGRIIISMICR